MEKMKCELCDCVARMFCEPDQASLCWDCDAQVHGANFLVAKHARCLLCSTCQSPTPWKASGLPLCPTISICESCLARKNSNGFWLREDDGAESYDEDEEEDEESDDEEGENQVVPWDASAAAQEPPVMSSSSSVSKGEERFSLVAKRTRQDSDLNSSDEESNDLRPLKRLTRDETRPRSTVVMKSTLKTKRL
ncbi:unnamed protein product [Eruca vesicaria subsp. sativa]|uniref:B box-type domain-containing protein n=1 Tax=Eruca vesicaria subsp. sativa TaxID=29727 RepID=A0ABC8LVL5_ERUVS|nr:unnamed protein product [Eruca vesicaria subsp. sativa]